MGNGHIQILDKSFKLYIKQERIDSKVKELAEQISTNFQGKELFIISILNGAFIFTADLIKALKIDCPISFVKLSSYNGVNRNEQIKELIGLDDNLKGKHVLIVEDIIDSGNTILQIKEQILAQNPSSISIATLLLKPDALEYNVKIDYIGFEVGNEFLVGYGLDYNAYGRGLKDIYQNMK